MTLGEEIETIRKKNDLSVEYVCKILSVSKPDYKKVICNKIVPDDFYLMRFMWITGCPLNTLRKRTSEKNSEICPSAFLIR